MATLGDAPASATPETAPETPVVEAPPTVDAADWRTSIPEDAKTAIDWKKFDGKGLDTVLKSYAELEKMRGGSVKLPKNDADASEWTKYYDRLRPADATGYNVEYPTYDGTLRWDDDAKASLQKFAHANGMHERQLQGFVNAYGEWQVERAKDAQRHVGEEIAKIQADYGPSYDLKIGLANRALHALGGDELLTHIKDIGAGNDPMIVRAMIKLGEIMADQDVIVGTVPGVMSRDDAKAKIKEIRANPNHAAFDKANVEHKDALALLERLYRIAND